MKTQNIDLSKDHLEEAILAVQENQKLIEKTGDTVLVLEDDTRVLVFYRSNTYFFQLLDNLL